MAKAVSKKHQSILLRNQRLEAMNYCVVDDRQVVFATKCLGEAVAFRLGKQRGVLCTINNLTDGIAKQR